MNNANKKNRLKQQESKISKVLIISKITSFKYANLAQDVHF